MSLNHEVACGAEGADSLEPGEREASSPSSILPLAKSTGMGFDGWSLPGHGESYVDCGAWRFKGCLNVEAHGQTGLFEDMAGKVYVKVFKRSCARAECPTCYEKWAGREASRLELRLFAFGSLSRVIHVIVSPRRYGRSVGKLRAEAYLVLRKAGFLGGSLIFHPFRQRKSSKEWYFSPHFHALGFGWIRGAADLYKRYGWVVKNAGLRKTVVGTAQYQLSHCGIHERLHSITWFGGLSYNKLRFVAEVEPEKECCPICGAELRDLWYLGHGSLPKAEGYYWLDAEGWEYKPTRRWSGG